MSTTTVEWTFSFLKSIKKYLRNVTLEDSSTGLELLSIGTYIENRNIHFNPEIVFNRTSKETNFNLNLEFVL